MSEQVRVNFNRPIPVVPLPQAVLLPHAVQPMHICEDRLMELVREAIDGPGLIAAASYTDRPCDENEEDEPAELRPAVCVGHIVEHEPMPGGRCNILLQGVCRARIQRMLEPDDDTPYRRAMLTPVQSVHESCEELDHVRETLHDLLTGTRLRRMKAVKHVLDWFDQDEVPTHALLELLGFLLVNDTERKYELLTEPDARRRARVITNELRDLDDLIAQADKQSHHRWPKGMAWN